MTYVIDENKVVRVALFESKMRVMRILNGKTEGLSADQVSKLRDTYGLGTMVI